MKRDQKMMGVGHTSVAPTGAVLYRIPLTWGYDKLPWKLLHAALMLLSLILSVVGLCAVFNYHNAKNIPNLYSLHSWIGIAAAALFAIQVKRELEFLLMFFMRAKFTIGNFFPFTPLCSG